jgi:hypothetical protein
MKDLFGDIGNIAEQKIREAIARGETKSLHGEGKPLKIENLYFLPPEFKFAYTVLKNGGFLNLDDDEKVPVSSTSEDINLSNLNPSSTIIQEKTSVSLVSDKIISPNVNHSNPTIYIQEKALNYNVIRDCRRGKF